MELTKQQLAQARSRLEAMKVFKEHMAKGFSGRHAARRAGENRYTILTWLRKCDHRLDLPIECYVRGYKQPLPPESPMVSAKRELSEAEAQMEHAKEQLLAAAINYGLAKLDYETALARLKELPQ